MSNSVPGWHFNNLHALIAADLIAALTLYVLLCMKYRALAVLHTKLSVSIAFQQLQL